MNRINTQDHESLKKISISSFSSNDKIFNEVKNQNVRNALGNLNKIRQNLTEVYKQIQNSMQEPNQTVEQIAQRMEKLRFLPIPLAQSFDRKYNFTTEKTRSAGATGPKPPALFRAN